MGRIRKRTAEIKNRKLYVILFPNSKTFFVLDTIHKNIWHVYDNHYRGRSSPTKKQFELCKKENNLPPMYYLGELTGTVYDSFQRKVEWSKYFFEHGFKCLAGEKMEQILNEFTPEDNDFYNSIKNIPIENIINPELNLMKDFRKIGKTPRKSENSRYDGKHVIRLVLWEEEYETYKKRAKEYGVPMSEYIMTCVKLSTPFVVNTEFITKYIDEINSCSNLFKGLLRTYFLSKEYFDADVLSMKKISNNILKTNFQVEEELFSLCLRLRRLRDSKVQEDSEEEIVNETNEKQPEKYKKAFQFYIKDEEYERYKNKAEGYNLPLSEYILECVRFGGCFICNPFYLGEYVAAINNCYSLFGNLFATYLIPGNYNPAIAEKMQEIKEEISSSNIQVKDEFIRLYDQIIWMRDGKQINKDTLI